MWHHLEKPDYWVHSHCWYAGLLNGRDNKSVLLNLNQSTSIEETLQFVKQTKHHYGSSVLHFLSPDHSCNMEMQTTRNCFKLTDNDDASKRLTSGLKPSKKTIIHADHSDFRKWLAPLPHGKEVNHTNQHSASFNITFQLKSRTKLPKKRDSRWEVHSGFPPRSNANTVCNICHPCQRRQLQSVIKCAFVMACTDLSGDHHS